MSQGSRLVKNLVIYSIGSLSSKILAYVMVLVYSRYISPEQMGYYDVVMTTISLLYPVVTLELTEGIYRFLILADHREADKVICTSYRSVIVITGIVELVFAVIAVKNNIEYWGIIAVYAASYIFYEMVHTTLRASLDNKIYATVGVANSFIILLGEMIGIFIFHQGITALWGAMAAANILCSVYMMNKKKIGKIIKCFSIDWPLFIDMCRYSLPNIPNTICWWIVNSCDRYIILIYLGQAFNGLYAMAAKFPSILTVLTSSFYISWQESALKEYNSENRDSFYTKVFHNYFIVMHTCCLILIPATKLVITLFMGDNYKQAWMYTGGLFLGAIYNSLSSFLGIGYQISKETSKAMQSSMIAALINTAVNILLIHKLGLHAASISTFAAYLILFIVRIKDTKKYFHIQYNVKTIIILPLLCFVMIAMCFLSRHFIFDSCLCLIAGLNFLLFNKELVRNIGNKLVKLRKTGR